LPLLDRRQFRQSRQGRRNALFAFLGRPGAGAHPVLRYALELHAPAAIRAGVVIGQQAFERFALRALPMPSTVAYSHSANKISGANRCSSHPTFYGFDPGVENTQILADDIAPNDPRPVPFSKQ
jgi:hypothetical protein